MVVGGLAFLVDFGTLYALTAGLHIYYLTSAALSFILGLSCNYALSRIWVFDQRTLQNITLEYVIFTAIGLIGLGLNQVGMWVLTEQLHLHYLLTKIGTTAPVFLWNFCARKYVLFR
jgi:putative flippase GtrA